MITYNVVMRIANDKDFLQPIFECIGKLKLAGIPIQFNIIGEIYNEEIYKKLLDLSTKLSIAENVVFTKKSIRYNQMSLEVKQGFFLNYSIDDVVGYSTMEAMTLGLKTILINCNSALAGKNENISFCNTPEELYDLTIKLSENRTEITNQIVEENNVFKSQFYLNPHESSLLLNLF